MGLREVSILPGRDDPGGCPPDSLGGFQPISGDGGPWTSPKTNPRPGMDIIPTGFLRTPEGIPFRRRHSRTPGWEGVSAVVDGAGNRVGGEFPACPGAERNRRRKTLVAAYGGGNVKRPTPPSARGSGNRGVRHSRRSVVVALGIITIIPNGPAHAVRRTPAADLDITFIMSPAANGSRHHRALESVRL